MLTVTINYQFTTRKVHKKKVLTRKILLRVLITIDLIKPFYA